MGPDGMRALSRARIAVFGMGGVGSYVVEALARTGIGGLSLFDDDKVCLSNLNRQLIATHDTIGQDKVEAAKRRVLSISPDCEVEAMACFYAAENARDIPLERYDYIVDAIDTVSSKLVLVEQAALAKVPIISCMGAGNKLDPTRFEVADIYQTSVCPLAKVMRRELRKRGIPALRVVYSREEPIVPRKSDGGSGDDLEDVSQGGKRAVRRQVPGSVAFVPSVAGLILAAEVVKHLVGADGPA